MPAQVVTGTVAVLTDAGAKAAAFGDQGFVAEVVEIFIHDQRTRGARSNVAAPRAAHQCRLSPDEAYSKNMVGYMTLPLDHSNVGASPILEAGCRRRDIVCARSFICEVKTLPQVMQAHDALFLISTVHYSDRYCRRVGWHCGVRQ